ncbi:MAG: Gfo/Idh/MocA family oxidoreductase [Verrucomicrobia bacterium]|nr:Gfo/Idh/MocA family oxidoreductase [Verrucomicrobiota bacterium]
MTNDNVSELNRRNFLRGGSAAAFFALLGGVPIRAADAAVDTGVTDYKAETPPVKVGVIGCGTWGREILKTLSTIPFGPVVGICDSFPAYLKRGANLAPDAKRYADPAELLANADIQAVVVATPSHLHRTSSSPPCRPANTCTAKPRSPPRSRTPAPSPPPPKNTCA